MGADEWFDVVDQRDEVIGRATRREVHARSLFHRAIHVLVFNAAGGVFLQKRSLKKDMAPGLWDSSCSGHLDAGETYDDCSVRELREELGLRLASAPPRWFRLEACPETAWEFVWVYRLRHEGPFQLDPDEISEGGWVDPAELTERIGKEPARYAPAFRLVWGATKLGGRAP
jgi:isopentenyl-diphosphate delta-isomerase type 1